MASFGQKVAKFLARNTILPSIITFALFSPVQAETPDAPSASTPTTATMTTPRKSHAPAHVQKAAKAHKAHKGHASYDGTVGYGNTRKASLDTIKVSHQTTQEGYQVADAAIEQTPENANYTTSVMFPDVARKMNLPHSMVKLIMERFNAQMDGGGTLYLRTVSPENVRVYYTKDAKGGGEVARAEVTTGGLTYTITPNGNGHYAASSAYQPEQRHVGTPKAHKATQHKVKAPKASKPAMSQPKAQAPQPEQKPASQAPVMQEPVTQTPVMQTPAPQTQQQAPQTPVAPPEGKQNKTDFPALKTPPRVDLTPAQLAAMMATPKTQTSASESSGGKATLAKVQLVNATPSVGEKAKNSYTSLFTPMTKEEYEKALKEYRAKEKVLIQTLKKEIENQQQVAEQMSEPKPAMAPVAGGQKTQSQPLLSAAPEKMPESNVMPQLPPQDLTPPPVIPKDVQSASEEPDAPSNVKLLPTKPFDLTT